MTGESLDEVNNQQDLNQWLGLDAIRQATIDRSHDAIFWHRGPRIVYVNDQACRSLGYTREELSSMSLNDIDDGLPPKQKEEIMKRILEEGSAIFETVNIRKDGSRFPVELSVTAHEIENEVLFCGIARDISERKLTEEKLLASQRELQAKIQQLEEAERRSRLAIEGGRLSTFEWMLTKGGGFVSDSFYRIFGHKPGEIESTYQAFVRQAHPDDLARTERIFGVAQARRHPVSAELRIVWPDDSIHWIEVRASFAYDADGTPVRLDGVIVDIDEKKATEARLDSSNQNLQLVLDASQMGTWEWELESNRIFCSEQAHQVLGYATLPDSPTFDLFTTHIHPDDVATVTASLELARVAHSHHHLEHRIVDETGQLKWIEVRGQFDYDINGKAVCMRGVIADVSERKQNEEELHLRRFAVDVASEAMFTISLDGRIIDVNQVACERLGYSRDELLTKRIPDISASHSTQEQFKATVAQTRREGSRVHAGRHRRKNGGIIDVEITAKVFEYRGHEYICATARDVTKLRNAEQKLRELDQQVAHLNRLGSMGEMASVIAHELNQPLSVIANNATLLELDQGDDLSEYSRELTAYISSQAVRAGDIVRRMRGFCLNKLPTRTVVNLQEIIGESICLLEPKFRHAFVEVETDFAPVPQVMVDRIQIQQVLVNLIHNGLDAMKSIDESNRRLKVRLQKIDEIVQISVTDNGLGIDRVQVDEIFEPFNSSKPNGMGMGLPISRSIVEAHNGRLRFDESQTCGTTFFIELPIAQTAS